MKTLNLEDFTGSFFQLLKESFEGPPADRGSAYLDKGAGLFQTLDALTAEAASARPRGGGPSVAAHCEHARFYVLALQDLMRGATGKIDWAQSWAVQAVSAAEWDGLKGELRRAYAALAEHLRSLETWGDEEVGDAMAILVHTAYHLGAIRQIVKDVNRESF
ncbi:MAG TPA: DinB family protein [Pyrinomonadaceae bacterium]|nr:DinB family protein [Pyrinomonadaceae bacterium]